MVCEHVKQALQLDQVYTVDMGLDSKGVLRYSAENTLGEIVAQGPSGKQLCAEMHEKGWVEIV